MTSLNFFLSRKGFVFFISEGNIAGYGIGRKFHHFRVSNASSHSLLVCKSTAEKSENSNEHFMCVTVLFP